MKSNRSPYEPDAHGEPCDVEIRAASAADAEAIARVDPARGIAFEELETRIRGALERIERGEFTGYTCVALIDGDIVGYGKCAFRAWSDEMDPPSIPDGWYLTGVEVLPSHRRRGIGRSLTEHRLAWLRGRTGAVYYFTGEGNAPSFDLHHALGFEELARGLEIPLPPPFSNDERHVVGRKTLG